VLEQPLLGTFLPNNEGGDDKMAARKHIESDLEISPELKLLLDEAKTREVSEEELKEQRVSFAYGNAPVKSEGVITKDSVQRTSERIRLKD
jgi:hypothetical protein